MQVPSLVEAYHTIRWNALQCQRYMHWILTCYLFISHGQSDILENLRKPEIQHPFPFYRLSNFNIVRQPTKRWIWFNAHWIWRTRDDTALSSTEKQHCEHSSVKTDTSRPPNFKSLAFQHNEFNKPPRWSTAKPGNLLQQKQKYIRCLPRRWNHSWQIAMLVIHHWFDQQAHTNFNRSCQPIG